VAATGLEGGAGTRWGFVAPGRAAGGAGALTAGRTGAAGAGGAGGAGTGLAATGAVAGSGRLGFAAAGAAFLTERMALAGSEAGGLAGLAAVVPLGRIKLRMRVASSSLMELLWLLAAMDSFSAASSTSLFSRPRSRDSS
jgi:hypothetical protein